MPFCRALWAGCGPPATKSGCSHRLTSTVEAKMGGLKPACANFAPEPSRDPGARLISSGKTGRSKMRSGVAEPRPGVAVGRLEGVDPGRRPAPKRLSCRDSENPAPAFRRRRSERAPGGCLKPRGERLPRSLQDPGKEDRGVLSGKAVFAPDAPRPKKSRRGGRSEFSSGYAPRPLLPS